MEVCIKAVVSGKVQGVFFRDTTVKKAHQWQLTGWVKNTSDGNVELIACGEQENIKKFIEWLWQGSAASKVDNVHWEEILWESFDDFIIR